MKGRLGVLEKDTAMLYVYDNEDCTQYMRCQITKLLSDLNIKLNTLINYISTHRPLTNGVELYKLTTDNTLINLITGETIEDEEDYH